MGTAAAEPEAAALEAAALEAAEPEAAEPEAAAELEACKVAAVISCKMSAPKLLGVESPTRFRLSSESSPANAAGAEAP